MNTQSLLDRVMDRNNLNKAYLQVKRNSGKGGVDKMEVKALLTYLKTEGEAIKQRVLAGKYKPQPVRRVEIPKPDGSGMRQLGIPTVLDRMLQQAISQVLTPIFDREFSNQHKPGPD